MDRNKLWKILKYFLIFLAIGLAVAVIVVFKKEAPKILGIYAWLYIRPEVFMLLAYLNGQNVIAIFLQVFAFTTFTTVVTWYLTNVAQRKLGESAKEGKLSFFLKKYRSVQKIAVKIAEFKNWFNSSKERYERKAEKFLNWFFHKGRYAIMIPFALPVLPGMDTACVILAKVIKLPYALTIFLAINSVKIVIILLACVYAPDVFHWLFG